MAFLGLKTGNRWGCITLLLSSLGSSSPNPELNLLLLPSLIGSLPFNLCLFHPSTTGTQSQARFLGQSLAQETSGFQHLFPLSLLHPSLTHAFFLQPRRIASRKGYWVSECFPLCSELTLPLASACLAFWLDCSLLQPAPVASSLPCRVRPAPPVQTLMPALLGEAALDCFDLCPLQGTRKDTPK